MVILNGLQNVQDIFVSFIQFAFALFQVVFNLTLELCQHRRNFRRRFASTEFDNVIVTSRSRDADSFLPFRGDSVHLVYLFLLNRFRSIGSKTCRHEATRVAGQMEFGCTNAPLDNLKWQSQSRSLR